MEQIVVFFLVCTSVTAFLFPTGGGGGGGGGGCVQPCPPCPPPAAVAPAPICSPAPACGRKKREATNIVSNEDNSKCNNEDLRLVLIKSIKSDVTTSLKAISENLKEHQDYTVLCDDKKLQYVVEADDYCQLHVTDVHCAIFRTSVKNTRDAHEGNDDANVAKKTEFAANEDRKKEEHKGGSDVECERKKREASMVVIKEDIERCNSDELRQLLLKKTTENLKAKDTESESVEEEDTTEVIVRKAD
ncbi:unnamed protein product [Angiostrongylus costaricensis]|uniref:Ground-like domain-containing protein n=1 Tax=Angiostrongylus costaricensis TaxID=334426 RepID=A0A158PIT1_ANGCS|nr:unnamed protein product [Angiostrongylus costaricensis]